MGDRPVKAILIDFYGTISGGDRMAVQEAAEMAVEAAGRPIPAADFARLWGDRFFRIIDRSNHDDFQTLHACELESLLETVTALSPSGEPPPGFDPEPILTRLDSYWRRPTIQPDVAEFLERNRLPLCVVSNADTEPLVEALDSHGLAFDALVTSEDARCYKPDPGIFGRAMAALDVEPSECLHVGDSLHSDIGGAARAGIRSVWICRDDRIHDIGTLRPDLQIASLVELLALIDVGA